MAVTLATIAALGVLGCADPGGTTTDPDFVLVGDAENAGDRQPQGVFGTVNCAYYIAKCEVTNGQYTEFLNAVGGTDTHALYNSSMGSLESGGILRSGSPGAYTYSVKPGRGCNPVNYVSWYDALRFANWLHNGLKAGPQDATTTENGAYDMSQGDRVTRRSGARYFLPSEDEWYKAAYYKGGSADAGYWSYATGSDTPPVSEAPRGGGSSANYRSPGHAIDGHHIADVGAYAASPSAYGTFDQNGNLYEWNEALIPAKSERGVRGGSWDDLGPTMRASDRGDTGPTREDHKIGFRVAASASPPPQRR